MTCFHCGSRSIPFSDTDRLEYCMTCNRGVLREVPESALTDEMLHPIPERKKSKMIDAICLQCLKHFRKKLNNPNVLCRKCMDKIRSKEHHGEEMKQKAIERKKKGLPSKLKARMIP